MCQFRVLKYLSTESPRFSFSYYFATSMGTVSKIPIEILNSAVSSALEIPKEKICVESVEITGKV